MIAIFINIIRSFNDIVPCAFVVECLVVVVSLLF